MEDEGIFSNGYTVDIFLNLTGFAGLTVDTGIFGRNQILGECETPVGPGSQVACPGSSIQGPGSTLDLSQVDFEKNETSIAWCRYAGVCPVDFCFSCLMIVPLSVSVGSRSVVTSFSCLLTLAVLC